MKSGRRNWIALPPFLLELELTETVIMQGADDVVKRLADLRSMGVTILIDDFGTGYSSLSYLQKLPIDSLKIDQSFIRNLPFDSNALSLMQALISLAHSLGMTVVAEGVETQSQLRCHTGPWLRYGARIFYWPGGCCLAASCN